MCSKRAKKASSIGLLRSIVMRFRFMLMMNDDIGNILFDLSDLFKSRRPLFQETLVKFKK